MQFMNTAVGLYKNHGLLINLIVFFSAFLAFAFPYLIDYKLPVGFTGDLSTGLRWFYQTNYFLAKGMLTPLSWDVLYSSPNYFLNPYVVFHYLFFVSLGRNIVFAYKLYVLLEVVLSGLSMLWVSYKLFGHRFGSLFSAIFYISMPYFFYELTSHIYYLWGYVLLPLAYYLTFKALVNRSVKLGIVAGLAVAAVTVLSSTEFVYFIGIPLAVFALLTIIFYSDEQKSEKIKAFFARLGIVSIIAILAFLISLYVIVPSYSYSGVNTTNNYWMFSDLSAYSNSFIQSFSFIPSNTNQVNWFSANPLTVVLLFLPIVSAALLIAERKRINYILFITGLVAVIFSVGLNSPLWAEAMKILPSFSSIRVANRFLITICFIFSLLAGVSISTIFVKLRYSIRKIGTQMMLLPKQYNLKFFKFTRTKILSKSQIIITCFLIVLIVAPIAYVFLEYNLAFSSTGPLGYSASQDPFSLQDYANVNHWLDSADPTHAYRVIDLASPDGKLFTFDHKSFNYLYSIDLVFAYFKSPSFGKILSSVGVRYIISLNDSSNGYLNEIPFQAIHDSLSNSTVFTLAYQSGNIVIFEDKLTMPWVYPAYGALTVGGPQALSLLYSLNLTQNWVPIYANEVTTEISNFDTFSAIVFHDSDIYDLALMKMNNFIYPSDFVNPSNPNGWMVVRSYDYTFDHPFLNSQNSAFGQMGLSNFFAYTITDASLWIPFCVEQAGNYSIWLRVLNPSNQLGNVEVALDSYQSVTENLTDVGGFKWIKLDPSYLQSGSHGLYIKNLSANPFYLDVISVVDESKLGNEVNQLTSLINESSLSSMYLLEFTNYFSGKGNSTHASNSLPSYASDHDAGTLLMKPNSVANASLYIATGGTYTIGIRLTANSGNIKVIIDNASVYQGGAPQSSGNNNWVWLTSNPISISAGSHTILVENSLNASDLDFMYIAQSTSESGQPTLFSKPNMGAVNCTQTGLMSWEGDSNVNQPAFLVFLESFAPNYWALQSQGQQQRPLQAFYAFNAFPLNSEITRFRIVYTQPSLITISQIVSAVTVTGVLVTMALIAYKNFTANRKMKRLLKD